MCIAIFFLFSLALHNIVMKHFADNATVFMHDESHICRVKFIVCFQHFGAIIIILIIYFLYLMTMESLYTAYGVCDAFSGKPVHAEHGFHKEKTKHVCIAKNLI